MTKEQLIAAAMGKPTPFEFSGCTYLLRPLTRAELLSMSDLSGLDCSARAVALSVCDEVGVPLLGVEDIPQLPEAVIVSIAEEVFRRCRVDGGKADAPKTTA